MRRRSIRGVAWKRVASCLPTSPRFSASAVEENPHRRGGPNTKQICITTSTSSIFIYLQNLGAGGMSSFIAWTQLVSTKHGVSRIGFLGHHCEALASDTAPKQSDISVSSSSISSQHFCNELGLKPPATERALRRITDRPTHIHSLATTAETRAFHLFSFTFSSFFFLFLDPI